MGFQTLGNDSRYTSVVQVNNNTKGSFQQEAARTYDVSISTSSSISDYDNSGSFSFGSTDTDRYYLFRDSSDHFTGDIIVSGTVNTSNDGEGIILYINGEEVDRVEDDDDFNDTLGFSGSKYNVPIGSVSLDDTQGYFKSGGYDMTIRYDSPQSSSYNVDSVIQE